MSEAIPPKNSFQYYNQVIKGNNNNEMREKPFIVHHAPYNNNNSIQNKIDHTAEEGGGTELLLPSTGLTAMKRLTVSSVTAARASWCSFVIRVKIPIKIFFTSPVSIFPDE